MDSSSDSKKHSESTARCLPSGRTLVLCFDGTGDQFDEDVSNVVKFFGLLKKEHKNEQMVYYQPGIGTYISSTDNHNSLKTKADQLLDMMVAWNLKAHVISGYEFLMQNYQEGDKISLFGFSRGAYTARALAGMIHKVGLLPTSNHQQVPFAYSMYAREDIKASDHAREFKKEFCIDVSIDFIGVWDTVDAVGLIPRTLPFTKSNSRIRVFRQALALDERRVRFKPAQHRHMTRKEEQSVSSGDESQEGTVPTLWSQVWSMWQGQPDGAVRLAADDEQLYYESWADEGQAVDRTEETDVLEVWFAGGHCDVGGGNTPNQEQHSLARIPLRWMIRECFKNNTGIHFHAAALEAIGLDLATLYPKVLERPKPLKPEAWHLTSNAKKPNGPKATEEEYDVRDAQMEMRDQLKKAPYWEVLEWLPFLGEKAWRWHMPNFGKPRMAFTRGGTRPWFVHRSVQLRMESKYLKDGLRYAPQAYAEGKSETQMTWVD